MGTKLEAAFDLRPLKEAQADIEDKDTLKEEEKNAVTTEAALEKSAQIVSALTVAEKVDHALTIVAGLSEHDEDMDSIAREALESYEELKELGMNMSDAHAGRIMEVSATMLKIALDARDAKVTRKLKTIDLQLKKMRIDKDTGGDGSTGSGDPEFDRNQILKSLKEIQETTQREE